jgi:dephospho-CoA kinase
MLDQKLQDLANDLIYNLPTLRNIDNLPNIFFVGKAGSGKSYSAQFMVKKYNYQVAKFAYPVYMIAEKYFNMKDKDRKLLQIIGTDCGREQINQDLWVNRFKEDMTIARLTSEKIGYKLPKFVMDDCRFANENKVLKELGFVGIYLDVNDDKRKERLIGRDGSAQENTLNHSSELMIDSFKDELIKLDANGTLEESYIKLNRLLGELSEK